MRTTVRLPQAVLKALDQRARALSISRNELVVRAIERELRDAREWSSGFFERLSRVDTRTARDVDDLERAIRKGRRSKAATRW